ncbi:MAG: hypothetical protein OHK0017_05410 [Patescibacteria group bacterium]
MSEKTKKRFILRGQLNKLEQLSHVTHQVFKANQLNIKDKPPKKLLKSKLKEVFGIGDVRTSRIFSKIFQNWVESRSKDDSTGSYYNFEILSYELLQKLIYSSSDRNLENLLNYEIYSKLWVEQVIQSKLLKILNDPNRTFGSFHPENLEYQFVEKLERDFLIYALK